MAGVKGKSGGDRKSAKAKGLPEAAPLPQSREGYARLIDVLNKPPNPDEGTKDPESAGWRVSWDSAHSATRLHTRMFLYRMRDGDPPRTINHLHDKPLELTGNLTFSIAAELREARERAIKR